MHPRPHDTEPRNAPERARAGQAIIFLVTVVAVLFFIALWGFDLHKIIHVKARTRNAGDAAAVMAARWQGISLNLIGELNVMQAMALSAGDMAAVAAISNLQARLCFVGPMIALEAAQQAAKNNGMYVNRDYSDFLREHAETVRTEYTRLTGPQGQMLFPEPYEGCWDDYADMLDYVAGNGVAAGPDNATFYSDFADGHILLMPDFYEAVAGQTWCWFFLQAPNLLEDYRNFFPCWWDPLPPIPHREYVNSEIFGLGLTRRVTALADMTPDPAALAATIADAAAGGSIPGQVTATALQAVVTWTCYHPGTWSAWDAISPAHPTRFPATGTVKPQYDYAGADAAVRLEAVTERVTPEPGDTQVANTLTWSAAAKPFGYLNESDRPDAYGLVLPAFHRAHLIPVDASSAPAAGGFNLPWRRHIEEHLPDYMASGPRRSSSCWYCRQLEAWEDESFRQAGVDWLEKNSDLCTLGGGPGGGAGGGTRRGH